MTYSNYPNGFNSGLVVRGTPLSVTNPGAVFWVYNGTKLQGGQRGGSNSNNGTYDSPFATIGYAVSKCSPNRGDIIFVKPGHSETISSASGIVLNVAGIAIVGMGSGELRPTLTFTAAAATIPITAGNVFVYNILHKANFLDVAAAYTATGISTPVNFSIDNCEFSDNSSVLNFVNTILGNATANSMDGLLYSNNKVFGLGSTAGTTAVSILSATKYTSYRNNFCVYPALNDTAALVGFGANNQLSLDMGGNKVFRPSTSTTGGSLFSGGGTGSTGYVYDNYSWHLDSTAGLLAPTGTGLGFQNNFCMITAAPDRSGLINPVAV